MLLTNWIPTQDLYLLRRLGKTLEELGELSSVVARCLIQGVDEIDPGTGKVNRQRLLEEISDVYAQLDETVNGLRLDRAAIRDRRIAKQNQMQEWEGMNK